jgi:hypothetical protein
MVLKTKFCTTTKYISCRNEEGLIVFLCLEVSGAVNICRVIKDTMVPVESSSQIQILSSSDNRICEYLQLYMPTCIFLVALYADVQSLSGGIRGSLCSQS